MIIFDCDGVLEDSEILSCGIDARLMTEAGFSITTESLIAGFIGRPKREIWAALAEERGKPWPEGLLERADALLLEKLATELEPVDGVAEALRALPGTKAVASSSSLKKLDTALGRCGLLDHFSPNIFSVDQVARGKPAPDVFVFAASQCGVEPEACLVIEDSVAGVVAARETGMQVIGFVGGRHSFPGHADRLTDAGAAAIVTHMRDLPERIRTLHSSASG